MNKIPKAFILFLISVIITEYIFYYFGSYISLNPVNPVFQAQIKIARSNNLNKDILIFGDSSAQFAIKSQKIQEVTGLTSYNFSTIGHATLAGNYFLFKNYLECNKPPKFLLLMNVYDVWHRDLHSEGVINVLAANFFRDTIINLFYTGTIDSDYMFQIFKDIFNQILPSLRYKFEIRRIIGKILKSQEPSIKTLISVINRTSHMKEDLMLNDGNYIKYLIPWLQANQINDIENYRKKNLAKDLIEHINFVKKNKFYISNLNRYYLNKFIIEANKRNIQIFICFSPILNEFYNNNKANVYLYKLKSYLENIAKLNSNVFILTNEYYIVTSDKLFDSIDHLDDKESEIFTDMIANRILIFIDDHKDIEKTSKFKKQL